jgi:hypothetical protein
MDKQENISNWLTKNIGWICPEHTPKPDSQYFDKPLEWFVGKYCKLGFPTGRLEPPFTEFMWVFVTVQKQNFLFGKLDNDPLFVEEYKDGDVVAFERNEICAVVNEDLT